MGGYSISTQSVTVPGLIRLVGAVIGEAAALGDALVTGLCAAGLGLAAPVQATTREAPNARKGNSRGGRFIGLSS